ncbi:class III signal peptide-containing protein [Methanotorris igneus]|uniref:Class III signal peptide-containing protein n=1 Tax=Methanotorris igneus (strain DSM 5666 / JCM 11834 / Kol 5) TaxID=880724 RepID=F6BBT1_METIK|nr:class III signal peptide-containing protein [Methanotorris igneus]AEF97211.1 Class III signal peptide-containing protein [Methanotorris igneus Kol 5]
MLKKVKKLIHSTRGQISLEFSILMAAIVSAAVIAGYYIIASSKDVGHNNIDAINHTYNVTMKALNKV